MYVIAVVFQNEPRAPMRASMPPPPISLYYRERRRPDYDEGIKLKLRSEPGNPASSEYSFFMRYLKATDNDPEYFCDWVTDLKKVINGQNITGGPARYRLVRDLTKGRHLFDFNAFAQELGAETIPHFDQCIRRLGLQIFPKQSKSRQIFALRNSVKPDKITIRNFVGRLKDISGKMDEVEPLGLDEDDWKDILVRAMPEQYIRRMFDHGFDPDDHDFLETLNMFERFETADNLMRRPKTISPRGRQRREQSARRQGNYRQEKRKPFRRNSFHPNRTYVRNPPPQQPNNGFNPNRRFNSNLNRRPNSGNNFNNHRRGNANRFGRNRRRDNNGGGRFNQFNRRQQEANVLDELHTEGAGSDTSL